MANKKLVEQLCPPPDAIEERVNDIMNEVNPQQLQKIYDESMREFRVDTIVKGRVLRTVGDVVLVDIGYKSEGAVPKTDFPRLDDIYPDAELEVYLETIEDETGLVQLSKQKADRIRGWERIMECNREGDPLKGKVIRKVKGGLLVDVGVPVFLPASQVDVHKVEDIGEFIGKEIEVKIIKIDEKRMNVIVSRKKFLDDQRMEVRKKLLTELKEGDVLKGTVKNLSDYGAFVDIGGCDALLYLSDISWTRIQHPSDVLQPGQEITVKILKIDLDSQRISVGYKQLQKNPWEEVQVSFPIGTRLKGKVVNIVPYGAFVEIQPGIEGLLHISEMTWTKQPAHPGEVVKVGDEVNVAVISVNVEKQEIGLSLKQAMENPWEVIAQKYESGSVVKGVVKSFVNYGAFVEIPEGIEGLLHVRDMSWTKRLSHPSEMLQKGQELDVMVVSISKDKKKLALGLKQLQENPWETVIPDKYAEGTELTGKVSKVVSFGVFVELESNLEGLIHSSRMGKAQEGSLGPGDIVEVKVEKLDLKEAKIGLSLIRVIEKGPPEAAQAAQPAVEAVEGDPTAAEG
jgi:small subunit ribosomal protein S1